MSVMTHNPSVTVLFSPLLFPTWMSSLPHVIQKKIQANDASKVDTSMNVKQIINSENSSKRSTTSTASQLQSKRNLLALQPAPRHNEAKEPRHLYT